MDERWRVTPFHLGIGTPNLGIGTPIADDALQSNIAVQEALLHLLCPLLSSYPTDILLCVEEDLRGISRMDLMSGEFCVFL